MTDERETVETQTTGSGPGLLSLKPPRLIINLDQWASITVTRGADTLQISGREIFEALKKEVTMKQGVSR